MTDADEAPVNSGAGEQAGTATAERRQFKRYAVEGDAEVMVDGAVQLFRGRILDLSLSGCFIETLAQPRAVPGTRAELIFRANGIMLKARARFRAFRPGHGAGFLFERLEGHTREGLTALIAELEAEERPAAKPKASS